MGSVPHCVDNVDTAYLKEQERVSKLPVEELKSYSLQVLTVAFSCWERCVDDALSCGRGSEETRVSPLG